MNLLRDIIQVSLAALLGLAAVSPGHAGLIHHYTFNGNAADQVGSANGTLVGDATASGGVLTLDGNGDTVTFGTYLVPAGGADFSVSFFAQFAYDGNVHEFVSQGFSGGPGFYIGPYGNEIRITDNYYWTATPPVVGGSCGGCGGVATPVDGAWHHYALVVDGSNAEFFIDGVSRATRGSFGIGAGGNPMIFGSQFNGGELFAGSLRDVRIYDNTLSSSQVAAIANGTEGVPEPGTLVLLGSALVGLGVISRRKRSA